MFCHVASGFAVTGEQWATIRDGRGFAISVACATVDWDAFADTAAALAQSWPLHEQAADE